MLRMSLSCTRAYIHAFSPVPPSPWRLQVVQFILAKENFLPSFLSHLNTSAFSDLLLQMFAAPDTDQARLDLAHVCVCVCVCVCVMSMDVSPTYVVQVCLSACCVHFECVLTDILYVYALCPCMSMFCMTHVVCVCMCAQV